MKRKGGEEKEGERGSNGSGPPNLSERGCAHAQNIKNSAKAYRTMAFLLSSIIHIFTLTNISFCTQSEG